MIRNLNEIIEKAIKEKKKKIVVAAAEDDAVLQAVDQARKKGIAEFILVGDEEKIRNIANEYNIDLDEYEIIREKDIKKSVNIAAKLVSQGKADILMKGLVDTSIIMKAVLNREYGLRIEGNTLSHISVIQSVDDNKLYFVTDGGMNLEPDIETKKKIIRNAVYVSHKIENPCPNVAIICAKEKVDSKMKCTLDAKALCDEYDEKIYGKCIIGGPFGLDNAISIESARTKKVTHPGAGMADILLIPNLEAGNILLKALVFYAKSVSAGIIAGAKVPVIVTSRSDSKESKLSSIALSVLL